MEILDFEEFRKEANLLTRYSNFKNPDRPLKQRSEAEESLLNYRTIKGIWDMYDDGTVTKIGERMFLYCPPEKKSITTQQAD